MNNYNKAPGLTKIRAVGREDSLGCFDVFLLEFTVLFVITPTSVKCFSTSFLKLTSSSLHDIVAASSVVGHSLLLARLPRTLPENIRDSVLSGDMIRAALKTHFSPSIRKCSTLEASCVIALYKCNITYLLLTWQTFAGGAISIQFIRKLPAPLTKTQSHCMQQKYHIYKTIFNQLQQQHQMLYFVPGGLSVKFDITRQLYFKTYKTVSTIIFEHFCQILSRYIYTVRRYKHVNKTSEIRSLKTTQFIMQRIRSVRLQL